MDEFDFNDSYSRPKRASGYGGHKPPNGSGTVAFVFSLIGFVVSACFPAAGIAFGSIAVIVGCASFSTENRQGFALGGVLLGFFVIFISLVFHLHYVEIANGFKKSFR